MGQPTYLPTTIVSEGPARGPGSSYVYRANRSTQKPPLREPTRYERRFVRVTHGALLGSSSAWPNSSSANAHEGNLKFSPALGTSERVTPAVNSANNKARANLLNALGATAGVGINLVQYKQSTEMMGNRLVQLYRFAKAVKRFDVLGAADALGIHRRDPAVLAISKRTGRMRQLPRGKKKYASPKQAASLWLEFWFGWSPLISDVYACAEFLSSDVPGGYFESSKVPPIKIDEHAEGIIGPKLRYPTVWSEDLTGKVFAKAGGEFYVSNPNLYLANRLGLVNPAIIVYDAIPFSFVVNWFVNIEQFISSYSDLLGLKIERAWYANTVVASYSSLYRTYDATTGQTTSGYTYTKEAVHFRRFLGVVDVKLLPHRTERISLTRAATAISLLIQQLPKS